MADQNLLNFYKAIKSQRSVFNRSEVESYLAQVDEARVNALAKALGEYLAQNLPKVIKSRANLGAYKMNPYVLMTSASTLRFEDPHRLASFLFDTKFYMGLETSFGKSIESKIVGVYPIGAVAPDHWSSPVEKDAESLSLASLSNEEKAVARTESIWREIDQSSVVGDRRYLTSIKSGHHTINDTQVAAMQSAIAGNWRTWRDATTRNYPKVEGIDLVIGLTYGTERTTNNKENQILVKLLGSGFRELDRSNQPGVLVDEETGRFRVYRRVGRDFWSFVGRPDKSSEGAHVFLEVLLGLAKGLSLQSKELRFEDAVNFRIQALSAAISGVSFTSMPDWLKREFSVSEGLFLAVAATAFFDEGV